MRIIYFGLKLLWIPPTVLQECESPIPRWTEVVYDKCQDYGRWQLPTYEYESKWVSRMNEGKLIHPSRWAHLVRTCKIKIQYSNFPHMKSLTLLLIPLLFLSSCTIDWKDEKDDLFVRKQECAKYIPKVEDEFKNWRSEYTSWHKLYELFYSKKLNTCLKAYTLIWWITEKVTVYAIDDVLSKENIFQKSTWEIIDFEIFENKIKELKWE